MSMELSFKLEKFEGPLDLLLRLIEKNKIDIFDIPIVTITDQYLAYVRSMHEEDLDILSDFLVMSATLLDIKSKMLLPPEETEENEEQEDPRDELVRRLLEYKMYRYMADELKLCELKARTRLYRAPSIPAEVRRYEAPVDLDALLGGLTLDELKGVYQQLIRRRASLVDPIRSGFGTIRREPVSVEDAIDKVMAYARKKRHFSFRQAVRAGGKKDRIHVVAAFLAVLELMKIGKIRLTQEKLFDDMDIETIEKPGEKSEVDLEGLEDYDE